MKMHSISSTTEAGEDYEESPSHLVAIRPQKRNSVGDYQQAKQGSLSAGSGTPPQPKQWQARDILTETGLHGFPELYEAVRDKDKCYLFTWALICIFACACLVWQIHDCYFSFVNNPILTTYELRTGPEGMMMPSLLLCPSNRIHVATWRDADINKTWEEEHVKDAMTYQSNTTGLKGILAAKTTMGDGFAGEMPPAAPIYSGWCKKEFEEQDGLNETGPIIPDSLEHYFQLVGYPIEALFRECAFRSRALDCNSIVTPVFHRDHGKCFHVQLPVGNRQQTTAGVGISLVLSLDAVNGYPSNYDIDGVITQPLYDALHLQMHPPDSLDIGSLTSTLISPGTYTIAAVRRTEMHLVKQLYPWAQKQLCLDENDYSLMMTNTTYTMGACQLDCQLSAAYNACDCVMPVALQHLRRQWHNTSQCTPGQMRECVHPALDKNTHKRHLHECYAKCETPCHIEQYDVSTSTGQFPTANLRGWTSGGGGGGVGGSQSDGYDYYPLHNNRTSICDYQYEEYDKCPTMEKLEMKWVWVAANDSCELRARCTGPPGLVHPNTFASRTECTNACDPIKGNPCAADWQHVLYHAQNADGCGTQVFQQFSQTKVVYNQDQGCQLEEWGGCNAASNLFDDEQSCQDTCENKESGECLMSASITQLCPTSFNSPDEMQFTYNQNEEMCVPAHVEITCFDETMPPDHHNLYPTWEACQDACVRTPDSVPGLSPPSAACSYDLVWSAVPCVTSWHYNRQLGLCQPDIGHECGRDINHFDTLEQCEQACAKFSFDMHLPAPTPLPTPTPTNSTPSSNTARVRRKRQTSEETTSDSELGLSGDMIILDVYYPTLQHTVLTQSASMTLSTFVGNIGGQCGLWLGASIISCIKIVIIAAPLCISCIKPKRN